MAVTSVGFFRCLDRDACFRVDDAASVARLAHEASDCDCDGTSGDETETEPAATVRYITRDGQLTSLCVAQAEELMQCNYARRLVFQRSRVLRNYAFWGYTPSSSGGFARLEATAMDPRSVAAQVAIGHVASLADVERTALGLFATATIAEGEWIGEYTGVVQVEPSGGVVKVEEEEDDATHDAYGMCYPSVFEDGQLYLTAAEYGNEIRCINHSATPNVRFTPLLHDDGLLHVDCFALRQIVAGEQLLVDYGPTYWRRAGIEPLVDF